jgi:hypothetical protein
MRLNQGNVNGMTLSSNKKTMEPSFEVFRGVPYATSERWEPSMIIKKFENDVGSV